MGVKIQSMHFWCFLSMSQFTRFLGGPNGRKICARKTKYLRETQQQKKVKIQSSNWNCPNIYFQIKTIPSSKIEGVVGAEFPEPPTSRFLTSSWIGTQVLDIINKYKNRKGENVSLQVENKQKKSHLELSYLKLDLNASIPNIQQIKRKKIREIQKQKKRNISLRKVQIQNTKRATSSFFISSWIAMRALHIINK